MSTQPERGAARLGGVAHSPSCGDGSTFTVRAARRAELPGIHDRCAARPDEARPGRDGRLVRGGREVFTRRRDPYTRVVLLPSSRHVRIEVDGGTVAESTSPRLLFETGLPVRCDLPSSGRMARRSRRRGSPACPRRHHGREARGRAPLQISARWWAHRSRRRTSRVLGRAALRSRGRGPTTHLGGRVLHTREAREVSPAARPARSDLFGEQI
jgi:hypothetical protein